MTNWEYIFVTLPTTEAPAPGSTGSSPSPTLDAYGNQGWEAVGTVDVSPGSCTVLMKRTKVHVGRASGGRM